jgi:DSF synthase
MKFEFSTIDVRLDVDSKILWVEFLHQYNYSFTRVMLDEVLRLFRNLHSEYLLNRKLPFTHLLFCSKKPEVFHLGGDLEAFVTYAKEKDLKKLREYGETCVEILMYLSDMKMPFITGSIIQGDSLGGGFEFTLATQLRIAERHCKIGYPEVKFGLFPGMGAWSYGLRLASNSFTERMIFGGERFTADEMCKEGLISHVTETGNARKLAIEIVSEHQESMPAYLSMFRAQFYKNGVSQNELNEIVHTWADAALLITDDNMRKMTVLVSAQNRKLRQG